MRCELDRAQLLRGEGDGLGHSEELARRFSRRAWLPSRPS
jgi:hypothetical protein